MVLAAGLHITRGEFEVVPMNVILFALAAFVIWGRTNKAPIARAIRLALNSRTKVASPAHGECSPNRSTAMEAGSS